MATQNFTSWLSQDINVELHIMAVLGHQRRTSHHGSLRTSVSTVSAITYTGTNQVHRDNANHLNTKLHGRKCFIVTVRPIVSIYVEYILNITLWIFVIRIVSYITCMHITSIHAAISLNWRLYIIVILFKLKKTFYCIIQPSYCLLKSELLLLSQLDAFPNGLVVRCLEPHSYIFSLYFLIQSKHNKPASRIPTIIVEITWQYVSGGDHRNNWLSTTSYKPDDSNPLE